jgi:hypothetical protein
MYPRQNRKIHSIASPLLPSGGRIPPGEYIVELHVDGKTATIYEALPLQTKGKTIWNGGWIKAAAWVQKKQGTPIRGNLCFLVKQNQRR